MRTNSPISDPELPTIPDDDDGSMYQIDEDVASLTDLAKDKDKWAGVKAYLCEQQEYWRRYMPGGVDIKDIPAQELGNWWKCAAVIIEQYDHIISLVEAEDAIQQRRRG